MHLYSLYFFNSSYDETMITKIYIIQILPLPLWLRHNSVN